MKTLVEIQQIETKQNANVKAIIGTVVTLRNYLGKDHVKLAKIVAYVPPCVWKLDRKLSNGRFPASEFHADADVCTPEGKTLSDHLDSIL